MTVSPTYSDTLTLPAPPVARPVVTVRRLVKEQAIVAGGQALSGAGNMVFILAAAHSLGSRDFAQLATFLALYLLLLVPTAGLAAGAAAAPELRRTSTWALRAAAPAGVAIAAAAVPLGATLHLSWGLVALLGASLPSSAFLAIIRGRLYGAKRPAAAVATLLAEPAVRLGAGLLLMQSFGAIGAASGVVLGGYLALAVGFTASRTSTATVTAPAAASRRGTALAAATATTFTALTLLANLDVVLANRILGAAAGSFAAVSTLGGISAFATATIPLVLLPRMRPGATEDRRALVVALGAAGCLGGGVAVAAALAPGSIYSTLLGNRYAGIGTVAVPYLAAMALLGVARLLAARLCLRGRGRLVTAMAIVAIGIQVSWILLAARTAAGVASGTEVAIASLTVALGAAQLLPTPVPAHELPGDGIPASLPQPSPRRTRRLIATVRSPIFWLLLGLTAAAAAVRLVITRGLWVDEATSIHQAHLSYTGMLTNLRTTDVHPPGYFTLLWLWVRGFGFGPLSVRMPSILLGIALVPAMFGLARDLFDRRTAVIAATFTVVAPQAVWYSQEARMYSLFMLLTVLAVWAQVRVVRSGSRLAWLGYTLATAGMVYTQYFTSLVIAAQQLVFLAVLISRRRRGEPVGRLLLGWLLAMTAVLVLVAPLVPFAHQQFSTNQSAGRGFGAPTNTGTSTTTSGSGLSAYTVIANLLWATWGYHSNAVMKELGALWPAALLLSLALLGRGRSRSTLIIVAVAAIPVGGLFLVGTQKQFLFDLRYFIGCVPMIVILGARAAASWPRSRVGVVALTGVLVTSLGWGLWDQQVNGDNPRRYDFKPALQTVAQHAGPNADVVLSPAFLADVAEYYAPHQHYVLGTGSATGIASKVEHTREVFVVGSFFTTGGEDQQLASIRKSVAAHRHLVRSWSFDNVKVWEFK
jgi:4-amino-4-deoxy-L-arabinose transferase-like glycosyltransferase